MDQQKLNQQDDGQQNMNQQNMNQQNMNQQNMNQQYYYQQNQYQQATIHPSLAAQIFGQYDMEDIEPETMSGKKILNRAGIALSLMAVAVLLAQIGAEYLVSRYYPALYDTNWYIWALTAFTVVGVGLPTFYLSTKGIPDSRKREPLKLKFTQFIGLFFVCAAAMYITNFFSGIITFAIAMLKGEGLADMNPLIEAITGSNFILTLIYAALVAPIVEEIIFRKLLLNKLRRFGDVPAIIITGVAFGLFHMNLAQMFYATVLGMIFAYVAIRTNTIKYTIILHIMINFIGAVVAPLATKTNMVFGIILVLWVLGAITLGTVYFILNMKTIRLYKTRPLLEKKSHYFLNAGTLLYTIICLVMIVVITIS